MPPGERSEGSASRVRSAVRIAHAAWQGACLTVLVALIAVRWLRYVFDAPGPHVDHLLGTAMILETQSFLWTWALSYAVGLLAVLVWPVRAAILFAILAAIVVALLAWRPALLRGALPRRRDGLWRFPPLLVSTFCAVLLALHSFLDANRFVALVCGVSLVGVAAVRLDARRRLPGLGPRAGAAVACGFFGLCLATAPDVADALTVVLWACLVLVALLLLPRRLGPAEIRWLLLLGVVPANLAAAVLPLVLPLHDGRLLGDGLAYAFCEMPREKRLYASVPECSSVQLAGLEPRCRDGRIVAYDTATLEPVARYDFFSANFGGRFERLTCLDDEVQVAMQATWYRGRSYGQTALSFRPAVPGAFTPVVAGAGVGSNIAYDPRRDALFYAGEFTHRLRRLDRRTGEAREIDDAGLERAWANPVPGMPTTGSFGLKMDSTSDRLYLYEYHQGRSIYALDLSTLEIAARYDLNSGAGWGVVPDPERGRLITASTWGLELVDAATGDVLQRRRLGLGVKEPVLDAARNRLYVTTTVEGKLRVLDRDTLERIDQIPIGFGARYPHLAADGTRLYASSLSAHYAWDAARLADGAPDRLSEAGDRAPQRE